MISRVAGFSFIFFSAFSLAGGSPDSNPADEPAQAKSLETVKPTAGQESNAARIYIDPKTGQITEPPADVAAQMEAQEQSLGYQAEDAPLETFTMPSGGVGVVVGDRFHKPVNISTDCDGNIVEQGHDVNVSEVNTDQCN